MSVDVVEVVRACLWLLEIGMAESLLPYRFIMEDQQQQPLSFSISVSASSAAPSAASEEQYNPSDTVIFFGISLALGIACRHLLRGTRVPYTVALLILGIALGSLGSSSPSSIIIIIISFVIYDCLLY